MNVPGEIRDMLHGRPQVGAAEQAFPFLTVDAEGFPHVALLSRAELDPGARPQAVLAVVHSAGPRANVLRSRRALLVSIAGATAHYSKLALTRSIEAEGFLVCAFEMVADKADTIGVPIEPTLFPASERVAAIERWDVTERLLSMIAKG